MQKAADDIDDPGANEHPDTHFNDEMMNARAVSPEGFLWREGLTGSPQEL